MSVPGIQIREASGSEDVALVRRLFASYGEYLAANPSGAANICIADYERELAGLPGPYSPPGGTLLLAFLNERPVGCCALRPFRSSNPDAKAVELKRLWVERGARGLGLGLMLIEAALGHAKQMGASEVYLDTVPAAMPEANRLYGSLGFLEVERYNDNPVPDVVFFRKRLQ